jgi:predicted nucleic acid-binding Zn ribbon protein
MLERERLRLTDTEPPPPEPDLSLRPAITGLFKKLDTQAGSAICQIQAKWELIAGEKVANHSRPGQLAGDVLYVYVDSSAWLDEITRFHSNDILGKIKKEFGSGTVKKIRFQVQLEPP